MIKDMFVKREEGFTVTICANGYMFEAQGRDAKDDWVTGKFLCATFNDLVNLIADFEALPKS